MANIDKINGRDYKVKKLDNGKYTVVHKDTNKKLIALDNSEFGEYDRIYNISSFFSWKIKLLHCFKRWKNIYIRCNE